jgi:hypothetical protein
MTDQRVDLDTEMTEAERVLLEHRAAVRVNLPTHARHAAQTVRHALNTASYASLPPPPEVLTAAETVARWANEVCAQVEHDLYIRQRTGASAAAYQQAIERALIRSDCHQIDPDRDADRSERDQEVRSTTPAPLWVGGHTATPEAASGQDRGWQR